MHFTKFSLGTLTFVAGLSFASLTQAAYDYPSQNPTYQTDPSTSFDRSNLRTSGISDQELARKIRDRISSGWFTRGYDQVLVQVSNGMVTIQGRVNTLDDKEKVEKEIRDIDGVRGLNSQIVVQDTSGASQSQYARSNSQPQYSNQYSTTSPQYSSQYTPTYPQSQSQYSTQYTPTNPQSQYASQYTRTNPQQYSQGQSSYYTQQPQQSGQYARDSQQTSYSNDFPQDRAASSIDQQLNRRIRDNVSRGWFTNSYKEIVLNTNNGFVVIEGFVDNMDDQQKLIIEIQKIDGVRGVRSNIRIKNPQN